MNQALVGRQTQGNRRKLLSSVMRAVGSLVSVGFNEENSALQLINCFKNGRKAPEPGANRAAQSINWFDAMKVLC